MTPDTNECADEVTPQERRKNQWPLGRGETWGAIVAIMTLLGLGPSVIVPWAMSSYVEQVAVRVIKAHNEDRASHLELFLNGPAATAIREKGAADTASDHAMVAKLDNLQKSLDEMRVDIFSRLARLETQFDNERKRQQK
jgi:hypothetical protein